MQSVTHYINKPRYLGRSFVALIICLRWLFMPYIIYLVNAVNTL